MRLLALAAFIVAGAAAAAEPRISLQDSFRLGSGGAVCSAESSSLSTMLTPISEIAAMMSSICSDDIWSCGRASLSSS